MPVPWWSLDMLSKWDVDYNVRPCAKLDLGARVPEGQTPMRDGEEPALRELVKLLKDDANSLWPLPPKMVRTVIEWFVLLPFSEVICFKEIRCAPSSKNKRSFEES